MSKDTVIVESKTFEAMPSMVEAFMSEGVAALSQQQAAGSLLIALSEVHPSEDFRSREQEDEDTIEKYTGRFTKYEKAKERGKSPKYPFPAVWIWWDGEQYLLIAGFHRFIAAGRAEVDKILVKVFRGSKEEAVWFAMKDNRKNGLQLSYGDMKYCVKKALLLFDGTKTAGAIAKELGCHRSYAYRIRKELSTCRQLPDEAERLGADDKECSDESKVEQPSIPDENDDILEATSETGTYSVEQSFLAQHADDKSDDRISKARAEDRHDINVIRERDRSGWKELKDQIRADKYDGDFCKKQICKITMASEAQNIAMRKLRSLFLETHGHVKCQDDEEALTKLLDSEIKRSKSFTARLEELRAEFVPRGDTPTPDEDSDGTGSNGLPVSDVTTDGDEENKPPAVVPTTKPSKSGSVSGKTYSKLWERLNGQPNIKIREWKDCWAWCDSSHRGFEYAFSLSPEKNSCWLELRTVGKSKKKLLDEHTEKLRLRKDVIDSEFGASGTLEWYPTQDEERPDEKRHVDYRLLNVNVSDENDWDKMVEFFVDAVQRFETVMRDVLNAVLAEEPASDGIGKA